jgi:hypothetical protein
MKDAVEMGRDFADVASRFIEYEDKWVAINEKGTEIVASGNSIFEVDEKAEQQGYENVFLYKVPRSDHGFAPLAR